VNYDLPNASEDFVHPSDVQDAASATGCYDVRDAAGEVGCTQMERELKITFDWRVTDKNLAKKSAISRSICTVST